MSEALRVAVRRRFSSDFALDVAFTIDRWPAVLFGPSGAGKSSLLRVIAGLDRADSASISIGDHHLHAGRTNPAVQFVAQRPALFPHLNVAQNVAFGLAHTTPRERKACVSAMLGLLGAEHLADRMPAHLSGGERQRVAIARALATSPRLLLLDEAFAGLDNSTKRELLGRLNTVLTERKIAALHVTHEVADAFALDAEVVVLEAGRVTAQGPVADALATERQQLLAMLNSNT
jgi:ABC-type sulfate/molybdate transport systems ATPase subunit